MLKSFFTILLLLFFFQISNAQNGKIPGQSEFEMAVVKNYPKAIIRKGDGYFLGLGVDKDYSEALKWYKKAAELNSLNALYLVGIVYKDTLIEGKTYADAVAYYLMLNNKGIAATNTLIGEAYLNGEGFRINGAVM